VNPDYPHKTKPADDTEPRVNTPHHGHTDEAAGGADSSPFEAEPSGEKADAARDPQNRPRPTPGLVDPRPEP
jgi:hypothetical protein